MIVQNRENICLFSGVGVVRNDRFPGCFRIRPESTYGFCTSFLNLENSIFPTLQIVNDRLWHGGKMTMLENHESSYLPAFLL